jgi:hypothetical protein
MSHAATVKFLNSRRTYFVAGLDRDSITASKPADKPENYLKEKLSPLDQKTDQFVTVIQRE